jgi:hypothetical protein
MNPRNITEITPFTIEGVTYRYRVGGILNAQSIKSANAGLQALHDLPEYMQQLLISDVNSGMFLAVVDAEAASETAYAYYNISSEMKREIRLGKIRFDKRIPGESKMLDGYMIKSGTGNNSRMFILGSLAHETDHHFRLRSGLAALHEHNLRTNYAYVKTDAQSMLDPTYLTMQRPAFKYAHTGDMMQYMRQHGIDRIVNITEESARLIFRNPYQGYFTRIIEEGIKTALIKQGVFQPIVNIDEVMVKVEMMWYQGGHPIITLKHNLHELFPMLSDTTIRKIVCNSSLVVRQELSSHYTGAFVQWPQRVQQIAPNFSVVINKITTERRAILGLNPTSLPSTTTTALAYTRIPVTRQALSSNNTMLPVLKSSIVTNTAIPQAPRQSLIGYNRTLPATTVTLPATPVKAPSPRQPALGNYAKPPEDIVTIDITPRSKTVTPSLNPPVIRNTIGQFGVAAITLPLLALEASDRLQAEKSQYPDYNDIAHLGAVGTDMIVDSIISARALTLGPAALMIPLVVGVNLAAEIANGIRDIPIESVEKNRGFLVASMVACEFSPELEQQFLEDFDNGGSMSRKFMLASAQVTKTSFKPAEFYYDMKKSPANLTREIAQDISTPSNNGFLALDDYGHPMQSLPTTTTPKSSRQTPDAPHGKPPNVSLQSLLPYASVENPTRLFSITDNCYRSNGVLHENMDRVPMTSEMVALMEAETKAAQPGYRYSGSTNQVKAFKVPELKFDNSPLPDWVQGIGVVGSLGTGWKVFVVTQLSWASFGAGAAVIAVAEIISHFFNKHERHKLKRRARNTKRVQHQCDAIYHETEHGVNLIDEAIALVNQYLSETDPDKKSALFSQMRNKVTATTEYNKWLKELNEKRMHDSNQVVDGHKIRRRTRLYCQSIHDLFSDNAKLLDEMDDVVLLGLPYGELEARQQAETNPKKLVAIKTLLGAKDAEIAQQAEQRRQASVNGTQTLIDQALADKDFIKAANLCDISEMTAEEKKEELKHIHAHEENHLNTEINQALAEIDKALDQHDYELAESLCKTSKLNDDEKSKVREEIAEERQYYLDVRFTNKLKAANEGISLVNNVLTLFMLPGLPPVAKALPMTDRQSVKSVATRAWEQTTASVTAVSKFKVQKLPDSVINKNNKVTVQQFKF